MKHHKLVLSQVRPGTWWREPCALTAPARFSQPLTSDVGCSNPALVCVSEDGIVACTQVITGSSDSTVRVWDAKTCDCITSFRPPQALAGTERAVLSVHANPQNVDHILVCTRSNTAFMMTLQGQVCGHALYRPSEIGLDSDPRLISTVLLMSSMRRLSESSMGSS